MSIQLLHHDFAIEPGCCLMGTVIPQRSCTPSLVKSYSQPKCSKDKKINLTTKRGHSHDKSSGGISLTKHMKNTHSNTYSSLKNNVQRTNATTLPSKYNSKTNSLSTSRHNSNQVLKIQRNTPIKSYPLKSQITFHQQTRVDSSNLNMLSDITMVQQEFISHGSTTLNALNYLNHLDRSKLTEHPNSTVRLLSNYPLRDTVKQFKNPLQKLADRRKTKLVL